MLDTNNQPIGWPVVHVEPWNRLTQREWRRASLAAAYWVPAIVLYGSGSRMVRREATV